VFNAVKVAQVVEETTSTSQKISNYGFIFLLIFPNLRLVNTIAMSIIPTSFEKASWIFV